MTDGSVQLLGDDVIHAVHNPTAVVLYREPSMSTVTTSSAPHAASGTPTPFRGAVDLDAVRQEFDRAERAFQIQKVLRRVPTTNQAVTPSEDTPIGWPGPSYLPGVLRRCSNTHLQDPEVEGIVTLR